MAMVCAAISANAQTETPATPVEIKVTARRFQFDPATITVPKGKPVKLVITSLDVSHGFAIKEFGIKETIEAKQSKTIEFTPDKAGRIPFEIWNAVST